MPMTFKGQIGMCFHSGGRSYLACGCQLSTLVSASFSIVMHVFDYSLLDRKDTFSISKRGNGRDLKILGVLCTR